VTILAVEGLTKRYGSQVVNDDVTFSLEAETVLGIVGPNGAGKSTLLNLVSGVVRPDRGVVRFAGDDVSRAPASTRARLGIGRTYQIPRPFGGLTVFENVLVAASAGAGLRGRPAQEAAAGALARAGLVAKANRKAGALLLLDRKRLELARALATSPKLLLLDEIGGGLTEPELHVLVELIQTLRSEQITVIWIEHIVHALLRVVDRLLCLTYGRVLADGRPREVLASKAVRDVYLGEDFA
jgi:branched-chain amino acid transport system ATP-binding protein